MSSPTPFDDLRSALDACVDDYLANAGERLDRDEVRATLLEELAFSFEPFGRPDHDPRSLHPGDDSFGDPETCPACNDEPVLGPLPCGVCSDGEGDALAADAAAEDSRPCVECGGDSISCSCDPDLPRAPRYPLRGLGTVSRREESS